jgi:hypothetical protein
MLVLVTDNLDRLTLQRLRPRHRLLARVHAASLDRQLAAGADPESAPLLAARATRLTSLRFRRGLAACLRRVVAGTRPPASVPLHPARIGRAAPELSELANCLLTPGPVPARGVALATVLLSEGNGPLYRSAGRDDLRDAARFAARALNGPW